MTTVVANIKRRRQQGSEQLMCIISSVSCLSMNVVTYTDGITVWSVNLTFTFIRNFKQKLWHHRSGKPTWLNHDNSPRWLHRSGKSTWLNHDNSPSVLCCTFLAHNTSTHICTSFVIGNSIMTLGNFGNMPIMLFTTISHKFSLYYNWETLVMCNFMAYADKCI